MENESAIFCLVSWLHSAHLPWWEWGIIWFISWFLVLLWVFWVFLMSKNLSLKDKLPLFKVCNRLPVLPCPCPCDSCCHETSQESSCLRLVLLKSSYQVMKCKHISNSTVPKLTTCHIIPSGLRTWLWGCTGASREQEAVRAYGCYYSPGLQNLGFIAQNDEISTYFSV